MTLSLRPLLMLGTLLALVPAAQAASLTRQPYLQSVTHERALVAFRTDAACPAQVRYGPPGAESQVAQSDGAGTEHVVALEGLQPESDYSYVVEACGATVVPAAPFRTAPAPGGRRVFFAAVGDFGTGGTIQQEVAESIRARKPELLLGLGDTAYESGTEQEVQEHLFAPMAPLLSEVPLYAVAGNHEYVTDDARPLLDSLHLPTNNPRRTERYYSFDWGPVHFVGLDSMCATRAAEPEDCTAEEQRAWLEQDLASTRQPWKVVFFHHPVWSSGKHGSTPALQRTLAPLFDQHGVDLVLTGHDHNYERSRPMQGKGEAPANTPGVTYLVVGSGGATMRDLPGTRPGWSAVRLNDEDAYGALFVTVEDGTLRAELVNTAGRVLDSFTLTKALTQGTQSSAPAADGGTPTGSGPCGGTACEPAPGEGTDDEAALPPSGCTSAASGALLLPAAGLLGLATLRRRRARR